MVFLLAVVGMSGAAPLFSSRKVAAMTPHIAYNDVALTSSELANWTPDRTTPSGGYESVNFDGQTSAELRVDNTKANTSSTYYQTEGIQRTIPNSDAIKANLYVDGSWTTKSVRAGLWGVARNSTNDISAYPIVEFTSLNAGYTGWRVWDGVNGGWTNLSIPYTTNAWSALEIVHNNGSGKFNVYINNELVATNTGGDSTSLNAVILNSYNYATNNSADDYAAHWSNLGYGDVTGATTSTCATTSSVFTTDLSTWDLSDTRANGHNVLTPTGLHIYTDGSSDTGPRTDGVSGTWNTDKAAGYYATNFALSDLGDKTIAQSLDYQAATGITPGLQLVTDFDNNGTPDGILVGESVYGNDWWLSGSAAQFVKDNAPNNGGGYGSSWYGTPNEWLKSFPDAKVKAIGYSLGSGVHGDGIIKKISLGCTDYTFGVAPLPAPTNLTPADGTYTNDPAFVDTWNAVPGAAGYEYRTSHTLANATTLGPVAYSDSTTSQPGRYSTSGGVVTRQNGGTPQGDWYWQVRAVDAYGIGGAWSVINKVTVDTSAPATPVQQTPPNNSYLATNDFYFTWSNTSDSGAPVKYEFQSSQNGHTTGGVLDMGVWNNIANGNPEQNNLTQPKIHSTGAPDGKWYWQVRTIDAAGNKSAWSSVWNVTLDTKAPVVAITAPHDGDTVHGTVTVSGTVTDTNPDHYYFVVKDSHGTVQAGPGTVNAATVSDWNWNTKNVSDGVYTIDLEARDKAGNKDANSIATIHVTVDNSGPTVTDNFTVNMGTGDKVTLTPTVTDPSGVASYLWSVSDSKLLNNPNDPLNGSTLAIGPAPKGNYTVTLTTTDNLGNKTTQTYSVTITPGNSNSSNNQGGTQQNFSAGRGGSTPQQNRVLGAETTTSNTSTGTNGDGSASGNPTGNVKGDSTTTPSTVKFATDTASKKDDTAKSAANFLGLGWWWLAVLAALLGFFLFVFRRSSSNNS